MKYDQSYGIVPLKQEGGRWHVFVVRHRGGHWTLPKGHPEGSETPLQAAERELFEETGLSISRLISDSPLIEAYQFSSRGKPVHKTVHYFIAEVRGFIRIQKDELQDGKWMLLDKAHEVVTYDQMKQLLQVVIDTVSNKPGL
jgi:8-oxo-dGTP pyrophosphatase MutT (NUDIX family)